ncbi:MAG: rhodanese-like domain-containing protein [Desulfomonilaceae bacterium]|nr:rhodanese-like domain-containing protein [Desulfomonilaceae bacterium]
MGKRMLTAICVGALAALAMGLSQVVSAVPKESLPSKADQSCLKCHEYDKQDNILAGKLKSVSRKAKTIGLQIGKDMEVVSFDDATKLENAPSFTKIPEGESVKIVYYMKNGKGFAKEVVVKKGIEVPEDKLISEDEVAKLVAQGPEKGKYVLLDSRPDTMFDEGHIPTAKKMPFFMFDKLKDTLLPTDKSALQIHYCAGFT